MCWRRSSWWKRRGYIHLMFIEPCVIIYFYSKTNQIRQCIKFILFRVTLNMFRTVFPSIIRNSRLYMQQQACVKQILCLFANKQTAVSVCCCMYSLELLMMDGETIRNMWCLSYLLTNLHTYLLTYLLTYSMAQSPS